MRALGEELHKSLGQPIDHREPARRRHQRRHARLREAPPDGYTICITNADAMAYNQFLFKKLPFDPETQLQPITNAFHLIHMLVVNSDLGVKNVDELIALSKSRPGKLSYLAPGPPLFLYMETLKKTRGADWLRVPFRGGADAVNAILGGSTPIALFGEGNVIGHIRAGKMTPLVMMNNIRSPHFPSVPLLEETGYSGPAIAQLVRPVRAARDAAADHRPHQQGGARRSSASRTSPPGTSPRAAWCRRSTRRRSSPPTSCATAPQAKQVVFRRRDDAAAAGHASRTKREIRQARTCRPALVAYQAP